MGRRSERPVFLGENRPDSFKILDKLTPAFIQKKIGVLLDELGSFIQGGGKYLTQKNGMLKKVQQLVPDKTIETIDDLKTVPLNVMNIVSGDLKTNRGNVATVQERRPGLAEFSLLQWTSLSSLVFH